MNDLRAAAAQVAARPADPQQVPQPTSDVSAARWFPVDDLPALPGTPPTILAVRM